MSTYRRNVVVGLTVVIALAILGWMILQFGGAPIKMFAPTTFPIRLVSERADGLSEGSPVTYRGVSVGRVSGVKRHPTDMLRVFIDADIEASPSLPGNVQALIRTQGLIGGGAALVLAIPEGQGPNGTLQAGQELQANWVGLDILPPAFSALAEEFNANMREFRESGILANLNAQITRAGKLLQSTDELMNDPKMKENLQASLANIREVTEDAKRISSNLSTFSEKLHKIGDDANAAVTEAHDLAKQLNDRVAQTAVLLERFTSIAAKVDDGTGTAGQIVNDPRLYESLVTTAQELNLTIKDLKRLIEQWEQEGVRLKLR